MTKWSFVNLAKVHDEYYEICSFEYKGKMVIWSHLDSFSSNYFCMFFIVIRESLLLFFSMLLCIILMRNSFVGWNMPRDELK